MLRCKRCNAEFTHADAQIADINRTCKIVKEEGTEFEHRKPAKHDWEEIDDNNDKSFAGPGPKEGHDMRSSAEELFSEE